MYSITIAMLPSCRWCLCCLQGAPSRLQVLCRRTTQTLAHLDVGVQVGHHVRGLGARQGAQLRVNLTLHLLRLLVDVDHLGARRTVATVSQRQVVPMWVALMQQGLQCKRDAGDGLLCSMPSTAGTGIVGAWLIYRQWV